MQKQRNAVARYDTSFKAPGKQEISQKGHKLRLLDLRS